MNSQHRDLTIEWRHLEVGGATCDRCSQTGKAVQEVVSRLRKDLNTCDVEVRLVETTLSEGSIGQSNMILLNGVPMETLLAEASTSMTDCASCGCLTGKDTQCRAVVWNGNVHEEIPADLIHTAALAILERMESEKSAS